jgi:hypothetical protein
MLDRPAVGRRPLRAHRNEPPGLEGGDYALVGAPRVTAATAFDEQRPDAAHKAADHRPVADLRFRDEQPRRDRVDGEDIEPGHVVRDEEAALRKRLRRVVTAHLDP